MMRVIILILVILTSNQVIVWTPSGQYETVASIPTLNFERTPGQRFITAFEVNMNSGFVAYSVFTDARIKRGLEGTVPERNMPWRDIYAIDIQTGEVRLVAGQTTDVMETQMARWSLHFSPDGTKLAWFETTEQLGGLVIYDLIADERYAFVPGVAYSPDEIVAYTDSRIVIEGVLTSTYYVYDTNGAYLYSTPLFSNSFYLTYLYEDEGAMYFGTNSVRFNLIDGSYSETPNGTLMRVAAAAPDTSVRLSAPDFTRGVECRYDVFSPSGDLIYSFATFSTPRLSSDGQTLFYLDSFVPDRTLTMVTFTDSYLPVEQLYDAREDIFYMFAGETKEILVQGGDSFRGDFFCGAG